MTDFFKPFAYREVVEAAGVDPSFSFECMFALSATQMDKLGVKGCKPGRRPTLGPPTGLISLSDHSCVVMLQRLPSASLPNPVSLYYQPKGTLGPRLAAIYATAAHLALNYGHAARIQVRTPEETPRTVLTQDCHRRQCNTTSPIGMQAFEFYANLMETADENNMRAGGTCLSLSGFLYSCAAEALKRGSIISISFAKSSSYKPRDYFPAPHFPEVKASFRHEI